MCSNDILMTNGYISANGRGCPANKGLGAGMQDGFCAGSGGAHGGNGGYGGSESNNPDEKAKCAKMFPKSYYLGKEARYEGSGGANGEKRQARDTGGSGGGIIWISCPGTVNLA